MRNSITKIISISLIIGLNWAGLLAIGKTTAYFNDIENSAENTFSAGTLDISLDSSGNYVSGLMYPTDTAVTSIGLSNSESLAIQYTSTIIPLALNIDPCNYVSLNATDGTQSYSGPLLGFVSATTTLDSPANWNYTFTIDSSAPPSVWNKTCYFKWVFTAWSKDVTDPIGGFIDVEEKSGGIRIGKTIVLNEILANPFGLDDALKPNGEWVELYNNSNINFDVNGWVVYDSDDSHELYITTGNTNTGSTIVSAHGFLVVYRDGDSDFTINNSNETIRLYNGYPVSSSILVDSYSWTIEKPEGFSYARIPDGVGAWVDPIPTPGEPNILYEEIKETSMELNETPLAVPEIVEEIIKITEEPIEGIIEVATTTEEIVITEEIPAVEIPTIEDAGIPAPEVVGEESVIEEKPITEEQLTIEEEPSVIEEPAVIEGSAPEEMITVENEEQPAVVEEIKEIVPEPAPAPEPEPELTPENNNENSE